MKTMTQCECNDIKYVPVIFDGVGIGTSLSEIKSNVIDAEIIVDIILNNFQALNEFYSSINSDELKLSFAYSVFIPEEKYYGNIDIEEDEILDDLIGITFDDFEVFENNQVIADSLDVDIPNFYYDFGFIVSYRDLCAKLANKGLYINDLPTFEQLKKEAVNGNITFSIISAHKNKVYSI